MSDEQITLRDTLSEAFEAAETPATEVTEPVVDAPQETAQEKADRIRDEKGRFASKPEKTPEISTQAAPQVSEAEAPKPLQRPSSWKKDYWDRWEKITAEDRNFAEYLLQREQQFASGVSTYKAELDNAKPILDAIQPFVPELQQYGIQPTQWIQQLGHAHRTLALGSPEQKMLMFARLAKDYNVPLEQMFVTGQDGQLYLNQQVQQAPQPQQDVRTVVSQLLVEERMQQEVAAMQGSDQYPHFAAVRETMAGLLQAGIATDLKGAYDAAVALPQHAELREAEQEQQRQQEEAKRAADAAAAAKRAKANAVSVRSATPNGTVTNSGKRGIRDLLSENLEAVGGGRV
jgi:hypothetical protein